MSHENQPRQLARWRLTALAGLVAALVFAMLWALALRSRQQLAQQLAAWERARAATPPAVASAEPPPPPRLELAAARFEQLPGWQEDDLTEALPALRASCAALARMPSSRAIGPGALAGRAHHWQAPCRALSAPGLTQSAALRTVLETHFRPYLATNRGTAEGLFTGYYEPSLRGSRQRGSGFSTPLYLRPRDMVVADLGRFRPDLAGRKVTGRLVGGQLLPYFDRAEIDAGALAGKGLEIVWVDDPVDAFFLHIQGSGRVELPGGKTLRLGYAGQNGHAYVALGKVLIERGALAREEVSMQSIRRWLAEHPGEAGDLMADNPSYVFFQRLEGAGPLGSMGVALTPGRSLAVDLEMLPLGAPMWLDASHPNAQEGQPDLPLRRLMVAQDTGGAIKGPVRGDVFWGHGSEPEAIAGRMKHRGRLWLLIPAAVAVPVPAPPTPAP